MGHRCLQIKKANVTLFTFRLVSFGPSHGHNNRIRRYALKHLLVTEIDYSLDFGVRS
jgi:hypothetical protein